jgi:uncharacterized protein
VADYAASRTLRVCCATLIAAVLAAWFAPAVDGACAGAGYDALAPHRALACAEDRATGAQVGGVAERAPSPVIASLQAWHACETARIDQASDTPCEIVRVGDVPVTRAAEIREALPAGGHPLFLWHYQSPTAAVFLAGSIHALKATLYPLPAQFDAAFERSDHLVVEVDVTALDASELRRSLEQHGRLPGDETLADVLDEGVYAELVEHLEEQGLPLAPLRHMRPSLLAAQLAMWQLRALGYAPESGVEAHFLGRAGERPVLELETLQAQLGILADQPFSLQQQLLAEALQPLAGVEQQIAGMVRAWLAGDDADLMRLFHGERPTSPEHDAFMRQLLLERNLAMADRIAQFLGSHGTYFVLVGAAHLAGEDGIPAILAARGVDGARIHSNAALPANHHDARRAQRTHDGRN